MYALSGGAVANSQVRNSVGIKYSLLWHCGVSALVCLIVIMFGTRVADAIAGAVDETVIIGAWVGWLSAANWHARSRFNENINSPALWRTSNG
ncbi:MAG: hypothetical protein WBS20_13730 [Lysobacterales bacterium]